MPITHLSFKKPADSYCFVDSSFIGGPDVSPFILEMDVDDKFELSSILDIQGAGTIKDVTFSFPEGKDMYAKIDENGRLTAIKQTKGVSTIPPQLQNMFPAIVADSVLLTAQSKNSAAYFSIYIRIYDRPTKIYLCTDINEVFDPETLSDLSEDDQKSIINNFNQFQHLRGGGLEVKPGGAFNLFYKVYPETAQQTLRFRSNSAPMQENIDKMTFSESPAGDVTWTTVNIPKDTKYFAGNPDFKDSDKYGTFLMPKRGGAGRPELEVQLQIVEYLAMEPKPLDYLATTLPVASSNDAGGRIGTIDGGLRITKDATGRSLIKDVYKFFPPDILKWHAKAVVLEMTTQGVKVMKPGIDFTYSWDETKKTYCLYEPNKDKNEKSLYRDTHGYAVAVHPFGKKMTWSDQKGVVDYSSSDAWKAASKYYYQSNVSCFNTSGFVLTSHYHFYNNSVPKNKGVNPVRCLKEYHYKWPGLLFTGTESNGSDIVSYWILPSVKECKMMDMHGHWALIRALDDRINYAGGELTSPSRFWTSSLVKKDPALVEYASWTRDYAITTAYAQKDDEYDVRPFHRF
jgi:hypothetical protein